MLDTSWVVEWLRNNEEAHRRTRLLEDEGLALSIISVVELYRGVFRSNNPTASEDVLQGFLRGVAILGINPGVSRIFGIEGDRLRRSGTPIGDFDLLIASTALYYDLTLLTLDRDFDRVEGLEIINL